MLWKSNEENIPRKIEKIMTIATDEFNKRQSRNKMPDLAR